MALHLRMQCTWQMDTAFPRDRISLNPCFRGNLPSVDANALCNDLATALDTWSGAHGELRVTSYDLEGTKPVYPNGSKILRTGTVGAATVPRELAVCLSFYGGQNQPRKRGRLYVPLCLYTSGATQGARPIGTQRTRPAELVSIFAGLGGVDVDWIVWSQRDRQAVKVTNWWVDDEWDVQRSRGLRPTARDTGTTSG